MGNLRKFKKAVKSNHIGIDLKSSIDIEEKLYRDVYKELYIRKEIVRYAAELMTMMHIITNQYKISNKLGKTVEEKFLPRIKQIHGEIRTNLGNECLSCVRAIIYEVLEYGVLLDRHWICFDGLDY